VAVTDLCPIPTLPAELSVSRDERANGKIRAIFVPASSLPEFAAEGEFVANHTPRRYTVQTKRTCRQRIDPTDWIVSYLHSVKRLSDNARRIEGMRGEAALQESPVYGLIITGY